MDYSSIFVILMGLGTVFFGLICLIALTMLMGRVLERFAGMPSASAVAVAAESVSRPAVPSAPEENRQEIAAAIAAVVAEELGTDITGIRIRSMRKL